LLIEDQGRIKELFIINNKRLILETSLKNEAKNEIFWGESLFRVFLLRCSVKMMHNSRSITFCLKFLDYKINHILTEMTLSFLFRQFLDIRG